MELNFKKMSWKNFEFCGCEPIIPHIRGPHTVLGVPSRDLKERAHSRLSPNLELTYYLNPKLTRSVGYSTVYLVSEYPSECLEYYSES